MATVKPFFERVRKAIRTIKFQEKYETIDDHHDYLQILPFSSTLELLQEKFMWRLVNEKLPGTLLRDLELHRCNVINNNNNTKYTVPFCRTKYKLSSFSYMGVKLWNRNIPEDLNVCKTKPNSLGRPKTHTNFNQ